MLSKRTKLIGLAILLLIWVFSCYLSFKVGVKVVRREIVTDTLYIKGATVTDTIVELVPKEVLVPEVKYLTKVDTVFVNGSLTEVTKIDTLGIIKDWGLKRYYSETLFDNDSIGSLNVSWVNQYNVSRDLSYVFTPIHREVTKVIPDYNRFRVLFGLGTHGEVSGQFQYRMRSNFIVGYQYLNNPINSNSHILNIGYDF